MNKPKIKKFNRLALKEYKNSLSAFSLEQQDILIGTLLGDASMQKVAKTHESNIKWEQKSSQKDYIFHIYSVFEPFILMVPLLRDIKGGNAQDRQSYWIRTLRHSFFSKYKQLFYKQDNSGKQYKLVPENIQHLLTPRALAYWFMDDGSSKKNQQGHVISFTLHSQGFSYANQKLLIETLNKNFGLHASLWKDRKSYKIAINASSINDFSNLIKPFILPSFQYKI